MNHYKFTAFGDELIKLAKEESFGKSTGKNLAAGAISGMASAAITSPLTLINYEQMGNKGRLSFIEAAKRIKRKSGYKGFYSGLDSKLLNAAANTGLRVGGALVIADAINRINKKKQEKNNANTKITGSSK